MKRRAPLTRSGQLPRVVMVTRAPEPGSVKTRLIPVLGAEGAASLHERMARRVCLQVAALGVCGEADVEVWHDGGVPTDMRRWLGPLPRYHGQPSGDLGERLAAVFRKSARDGARSCAIVGSDCPRMTAGHLREALEHLESTDLVLGPAVDGGYWLIGLDAGSFRYAHRLLEGIPWSTSEVFSRTMERAAALGLNTAVLSPLSDVDRLEDLHLVDECPGRLSVVIPTLRESNSIGEVVRATRAGGADEVIVADGGSRDGTVRVAKEAGAKVAKASTGRARQMNAGACEAKGDILLFLHADTFPPPRFSQAVRRSLSEPGVVAGAFSFSSSGGGFVLDSALTLGATLRYRTFGHPYGDQGIFLHSSVFRALGGFPDIPVMEDWELVHRLKRMGRVSILPERSMTTSSSFVDHGLLWSTAVNLAVIGGYRLGVDPNLLAGWRRRIARRGRP